MTTCPVCRQGIPDSILACPHCLMRRATEEQMKMQREFAPSAMTGRGFVRVTKWNGQPRHILTWGPMRNLTFCGTVLIRPPATDSLRWEVFDLSYCCADCREQFALAAGATTNEAVSAEARATAET